MTGVQTCALPILPLIRADAEGDLLLEAALEAGVPRTAEDLATLAAAVRKDRIAPRSLISRDERVFALNLIFDGDVDGDREAQATLEFGARSGVITVSVREDQERDVLWVDAGLLGRGEDAIGLAGVSRVDEDHLVVDHEVGARDS